MSGYEWPNEDGWPYVEPDRDLVDHDSDPDDDALVLRAAPPHLFDALDPLEQQVIRAHYGLDGAPPRSMKQLHAELGLSRAVLRDALGSGLVKLRSRFAIS